MKDACDSGDTQNPGNISWAAHHAENQSAKDTSITVTPTALLPLFRDQAHSVAMIRHAMDVVKAAINELNPGQIPVVTLDQPLYAIAKQVQWNWPDTHGEDLFVVMLGGLHTEMAALKTAGDWLQDSGWTQALVQAEIASAGTADSFLRAAHVSRTRRAHQVTVAALHILQHRAYDIYNERATARDEEPLEFEAWCDQRAAACPQFQYWATVLNLELCILLYIRSLRESNFTLYMDTLPELAAWFAALDHIHYARWLPVHIRDMVGIAEKHPDVAAKFHAGHFTSKKTRHAFSAISLDQAHEQNNATVKGDGGAVGLTENPSALRRWMVAGPEVARVITEFETSQQLRQRGEHTHHHEQTDSVQKKFVKDVRALTTVIEEMGSPFEEESTDLLVLGTLEIMGPAVVDTVRTAVQIGRDQFHSFEKERLADRSKPLNDVIKRNKLPPCADTAALAPCNHEEADTRMMLHAAAAMKSGHRRVLIRTVDTDVLVLAVWMAQELNEVVDELWLAFGTGKNFRYIAAHELSATLGPDKAKALPIFHAITGCDTVSSFAGRGKKTAWAVWETFPEVTNAFLDLASAPSEISEDTLATLERYVVLLYDRTCTCSEVNLARKKLFAKKSRSIEAIPPTQAALVQHVKRATYQGGHCWGQSLVPHCTLPSPCDWGWVDNDGQFDPLWTTLPEAAKSCYELICCGCEKGCSGRCKCKKAALKCTALCACDGDCSH